MKFQKPLYSDIIFLFDHYSAGGIISALLIASSSLVLFHYATCLCIMQWLLKTEFR